MLAAQNMLAHGASGLVLGPVLAPRTLVRVQPLAMVERDSEVGLFASDSSVLTLTLTLTLSLTQALTRWGSSLSTRAC